MQKIISKYGLAAHLAIVAVAPLFLSPICVFCLSCLALIWMLMEPSRIGNERLGDARIRMLYSVVTDPFFWLSLVLVLYVGIRFFNNGVEMVYDSESASWTLSKPRLAMMPGVVKGCGGLEFSQGIAFLVVLQGCRHALGKSARSVFLLVTSFLSGIGVVSISALVLVTHAFPLSLVECDQLNPLFIGSVAGCYLFAGTIALLNAYEKKWQWAMPFILIAIGGNAAGVFLLAPPIVHIMFGIGEVLILVYAFFYSLKRLSAHVGFKFLVTFFIAIALGTSFVVLTLREDESQRKVVSATESESEMITNEGRTETLMDKRMATYLAGSFFQKDFWKIRDSLSSLSLRAWKESPWLGTGLGSFPLDLRFYAVESDWSVLKPEQTHPLNGYWYVLAERGIIGMVFLVCPVLLLLGELVVRVSKGVKKTIATPVFWVGPFVLICVLLEAFVDVSLTISGLMVAVAAFMSLSVNSLPKEKYNGR